MVLSQLSMENALPSNLAGDGGGDEAALGCM